ncbi:MAG TPA: VOC family protein [Burkholderiales bacterium]|nr:VOC family protein [Burkholderiales bacterium]
MEHVKFSFSHVGVFVYDLDRMTRFYERVLGLVLTDRGLLPGRELAFLSGDPREHHQVVFATGRTGKLDDRVINQISFRVGSLEDLRTVYRTVVADPEASDLRGVNHGNAWTLYFRDPEKNRIEAFTDSPWYIAQPVADPLDLSKPAADIEAQTEQLCRADPSFMPVEVWRRQLAARLEYARHG